MTAALAGDLAQLQAEAAGVMKIVIMRRQDIAAIYGAARLGDGHAHGLLQVVDAAIRDVETAPAARPVLCVSCPRQLKRTRYCFAVVLADRTDPTKALTFGICERCGPGLPAIKAQALAAIKEVWPGSRGVVASDAKGHA